MTQQSAISPPNPPIKLISLSFPIWQTSISFFSMAFSNQSNITKVTINYQKLSPSASAPELKTDEPTCIILRAKETFSFGKNRYAKAYAGLVLGVPKGYCGIISPLPMQDNGIFGDSLLYEPMHVIKPSNSHEISVELFNKMKAQTIIEKGTPIAYLSLHKEHSYRCQGRKQQVEVHLKEVTGLVNPVSVPLRSSGEISPSELYN